MSSYIPYGKQQIDERDIKAVNEVLRSEFLTQGPAVLEFEEAFAKFIGVKHAVALSNGTAALHLGAIALGVKPGDRVITSPITFAASANCIAYCGGQVDFCDIAPDTYLMDLDRLEELLKSKPKGFYKGVIPVDFGGLMVDMERLRTLANEYDLFIFEDACHAPGASFVDSKGERQTAGNGNYVDAAIFSFHPVKHIACGEGGMFTTNDSDLAEHVRTLRTHGITKDPSQMTRNEGGWYYEMQELGFNYRLSDIHAALGRSQLDKIGDNLSKRNAIAKEYQKAFNEMGMRMQKTPKGFFHAYHLFIIEVDNRKKTFDYLRAEGILAQVHYIPVHLLPFYQNMGWRTGDLPVAENYYKRCISLPIFPALLDSEQEKVIQSLKSLV